MRLVIDRMGNLGYTGPANNRLYSTASMYFFFLQQNEICQNILFQTNILDVLNMEESRGST